jgi:hypothetical protein
MVYNSSPYALLWCAWYITVRRFFFNICTTSSSNLFPMLVFSNQPITSWSWIVLEKPPHGRLPKNIPIFYWTRRCIIVFTRALQWSPSWARSIKSITPHPVSLKFILILSRVWSDNRQGLDWWFTEHLQIVTTSNYSPIANSHAQQFTTARTKFSQSAVSSPIVV